jgi:hypothetical protein
MKIRSYFDVFISGIVPEEPVLLTLANGDIVEAAPPVWGIDIKCGKGKLNYQLKIPHSYILYLSIQALISAMVLGRIANETISSNSSFHPTTNKCRSHNHPNRVNNVKYNHLMSA